jgi:agmatinase
MSPRGQRGDIPSARWDLPFTGLVSFLRSSTCADLDRLDADIAVLGVPSDEGSPWKPGAGFVP